MGWWVEPSDDYMRKYILQMPESGRNIPMLKHLLTHCGRVTHICVSKLTIIGPDNGLSPGRRQTIVWTNAGILLIGPLVTNFSEILIKIHTFLFKKMHFKMSSGKLRPFCLGLDVLTTTKRRISKLCLQFIMTSSNGNIFGVTGSLCGEFTGDRWIPLTKASDAEIWCFLWSAPE